MGEAAVKAKVTSGDVDSVVKQGESKLDATDNKCKQLFHAAKAGKTNAELEDLADKFTAITATGRRLVGGRRLGAIDVSASQTTGVEVTTSTTTDTGSGSDDTGNTGTNDPTTAKPTTATPDTNSPNVETTSPSSVDSEEEDGMGNLSTGTVLGIAKEMTVVIGVLVFAVLW